MWLNTPASSKKEEPPNNRFNGWINKKPTSSSMGWPMWETVAQVEESIKRKHAMLMMYSGIPPKKLTGK